MKRLNLFLYALLLMIVAVACNDEFDTPPMVVPRAEHIDDVNMTIAEFKAKYWQNGRNFIDTCKEDIYIHGWVTSCDDEGNISKCLYIQDETAGIGISIDAYNLSNDYRLGQEIVLKMKDFWIGKYNGQYLIGSPEWYADQSVWEAGRMPIDVFKEHAELNNLPNPNEIAPIELNIADVAGKNDAETQIKYQGQYVIIRDVEWDGADGVLTYAQNITKPSTTTRVIKDGQGNQLNVTNSNYANFRSDPLPIGRGDVKGILILTGDDKWALLLRDTRDCIGFDDDTKGHEFDPWTVPEAIELQNQGKNGWVTGYIVGVIAPDVTEVSKYNDIQWTPDSLFSLDNTLVIAPSPDIRDYKQCIAIELPQGSSFRRDANLRDYPQLHGTQIWVKGTLATFMGMAGITDNSGSIDEYKLSMMTGGVTELEENFNGGSLPSGWKNIKIKGDKDWFSTTFDENNVMAVSGYNGKEPPFEAWLITPALDINNAGRKSISFDTQVRYYRGTDMIEVYVMSTNDPTTAELTKLNPKLASAASVGTSGLVNSGEIDLSKFKGTYCIGFRYVSEQQPGGYTTWHLDNFKFGGEPLLETIDDFETMNGGAPTSNTKFESLESAKGWSAVNAGLLRGGDNDSNPYFKAIGKKADGSDNWAYAVHLNGNINSKGVLVSPVISGGIKTLQFSYGSFLTESNGVQFRVTIISGGSVAKQFDIINTSAEKGKAYYHSEAINVTGDVQINIEPLCPSNATTNKDRFAIWNIVWEQ